MSIPSLDRLRGEAKRLKKAAGLADPEALSRLRAVLVDVRAVKLADCLHVIAREQGHASWPALKLASETAALDREGRLRRLQIALRDGVHHVVEHLLALDPTLANAHLGVELALLDRPAVERRLAADPGAATRPIGPRYPLSCLAFSRWHSRIVNGPATSIALAARLVALGADVNEGEPVPGSDDHRLSPLYGALGHADNLPLAGWLLDHGADPDDDESLYHATELGHHDGLRLLMRHGVRTARTNALYRMLDFDDLEGAYLLLEYGADPNEPLWRHPADAAMDDGNTLHHAIRRGRDGRFLDLLLDAGVTATATFRGHTPFALARLSGNQEMATALERHGLAGSLRAEEALLAAVQDGDARAAADIAAAHPNLLGALHPRDRLLHVDLAGRKGAIDALRLLRALGFDFDATDDMGLTPLQVAAWHGRAEYLPFLLELGPDLRHVNAYGGTTLETAIHGSANCPDDRAGDHSTCVRLLLAAGAPLPIDRADWEMGTPEVLALLDDYAG